MRKRISSISFTQNEFTTIHSILIEKTHDQKIAPEKRNLLQAITLKIETLMGLRPSKRYRSDVIGQKQ
jgi:hypothetical protein